MSLCLPATPLSHSNLGFLPSPLVWEQGIILCFPFTEGLTLSSSDPFCLPGANSSPYDPNVLFVTRGEMRDHLLKSSFSRGEGEGPWFAQDYQTMAKPHPRKTIFLITFSPLPGEYWWLPGTEGSGSWGVIVSQGQSFSCT